MYEYIKTWLELKTDKRAVTALEYGIIAAVMVGVCLAGFNVLGGKLTTELTSISNKLT